MQPAAISSGIPPQIADPDSLFSDLPPGVEAAPIVAALERALAGRPQPPGMPAATWRLQVLAAAGRLLMDDPLHLEAAIHLTLRAAPDLADAAPLAHVRLIAMGRGRGALAVGSEASRLAARIPADANMARVLRQCSLQFHARPYLTPSLPLYTALWGEEHMSVAERLEHFRRHPEERPLPHQTLRQLYARTRVEGCTYEEYCARHVWGLEAAEYLQFIAIAAQMPEFQQGAPEIVALSEGFRAQVPTVRDGPAPEVHDRTELNLGSHAGVTSLIGFQHLPPGPPDKTLIAWMVAPDFGRIFNVPAGSPSSAMRFVKLLKMLRQAPRQVLIFPDGGMGEMTEVPVLGTPLRLGRGAAVIGYHGKARANFLRTCWHGDLPRLEVLAGPVHAPGETAEVYEARLNAFYARCLEDILTGPPEDIGLLGGIFLLAQLRGGR